MATSLLSGDCRRTSDANKVFATEKGLLVLRPGRGVLSLCFTVPSGCYALVTSHGADLDYDPLKAATTTPTSDRSYGKSFLEKQGGPGLGQEILNSATKTVLAKTKTAVWPSGLHFPYPPWVRVSHLVTKQSIVLDLPVKACRTRDNVTVNIDVALSFRIMGDEALGEDPELVRKFVHQVKPRGLEQQLRDAQEEAVRGLARSMKHTEIYGIRSGKSHQNPRITGGSSKATTPTTEDAEQDGNGDEDSSSDEEEHEYGRDEVLEGKSDFRDRVAARRSRLAGEDVTAVMRDDLNKQFMPQGVQIQSIMIKSVRLPDDITSQMSEKTMVISANAQQIMTHQNEMQTTRMEQEVETMLQTFHEQRKELTSSGAETINAEKVKLNDAAAEAAKAEANIREETKVKIQNFLAEAALGVQRVRDKTHADVVNIETEANKGSSELLSKTKLEVQTLVSTSELQAARNLALARRIMDKAEGKVAPWLQKKKLHETKVKEFEVYENLARNEELIVTGNDDADGANLIALADAILHREGVEEEGNLQSAILAELALMNKGSKAFLSSVDKNSNGGTPPGRNVGYAGNGTLSRSLLHA